MNGLTHFDASGQAHMVDVSDKDITDRIAVAEGFVQMTSETLAIITDGRARKGDVLVVAQLAGIMGAKRAADLIPLCHPLPISKVALSLTPAPGLPGIRVEATVKTTGQTGVEMEALTAVSTACLTIYDMVKAVEKAMEIKDIRLVLKDGGKSGRYEAANDRYQVIGEAAAGHAFQGDITPGQCVRIFTGAPLPDGATRVVIQEDVQRTDTTIALADTAETQRYIRDIGTDFKTGDRIDAPRR